MRVIPLSNTKNWLTVWGEDGFIHKLPLGEEHKHAYTCVCNPVQQYFYAGGLILTHRVLTC